MGDVAGRYDTAVGHGGGQGFKTQFDACWWFRIRAGAGVRVLAAVISGIATCAAAIATSQTKAAHGGQGGCQATAHHGAASHASFQDFTKRGVLTSVTNSLVGDMFAHSDK